MSEQPRYCPWFVHAEHLLVDAWQAIDWVRQDIKRVERWDEDEMRSAQRSVQQAVETLRALRDRVELVDPPETERS
jgi:hypothetical protein